MPAWSDECDECGALAYAPCAPGCPTPRTRPGSAVEKQTPVVRRFFEGAESHHGVGDSEYLEFRAHHLGAWVINKHGKAGEMVHRIGCIHFYDDLPSTRQSPKLVGTTWEALRREEPRIEQIPRCSHCG